jgi:hypothetical protein
MIVFAVQENPLSGSLNADVFWLSALALLGASLGVYLFFYGFRMLQYKRLILNTPFSKIRSASMGLVEVSGTPTGPNTISAAITGAPCYYYRARGWQWLDSGKGGSWRQVVDESVSLPFFLEDGTGRVLVNPQGANLDVHRSFYDEFSTSFISKDSLIPESIRKFAAMRGLMGGSKIRLEEHVIKPGFPLFVFGTLGENSTLHSWKAQPHVSAKKVSFGFHLGDSINLKFTRDVNVPDMAAKAFSDLLRTTTGTSTRISTYVSRSGAGSIELPEKALKALQDAGVNLPFSATYRSTSGGGPVELPQDVLNLLQQAGVNLPFPVLATSGEMTVSNRNVADGLLRSSVMQVAFADNPSAAMNEAEKQAGTIEKGSAPDFDLRAPAAISKGERGEPFTISSQSQREVVRSLGWKAIACIWGGPVFALICLYSLLSIWGWM